MMAAVNNMSMCQICQCQCVVVLHSTAQHTHVVQGVSLRSAGVGVSLHICTGDASARERRVGRA